MTAPAMAALARSSAKASSSVAVIHSLAWWAAVYRTRRCPEPMVSASTGRPKAVVVRASIRQSPGYRPTRPRIHRLHRFEVMGTSVGTTGKPRGTRMGAPTGSRSGSREGLAVAMAWEVVP